MSEEWRTVAVAPDYEVSPRPDGLEVRHLDGDPANNALVNLRYGTRSENAQDMCAHGTHRNLQKTHCPQGHPYNEVNTYVWGSSRRCRTCNRNRRAATRAAA